LPLDEISLGKTIIDGEQAWVDTEVVIAGDDSFRLPLKTVLLKENKQWKVDYNATMHSISRGSSVARVLGSIANLSEKFSNELNRSLDEIQKIIPEVEEEIGKIEENISKKLPELRKRIEEILQQLEEALGNIGNKKKSSGTTEI
jgi:chromosome segregation ATPase